VQDHSLSDSMSEIEKLRSQLAGKFKEMVEDIQRECPHPEGSWTRWRISPTNINFEVRYCGRCSKLADIRKVQIIKSEIEDSDGLTERADSK